MAVFLGIDAGTTNLKAALADENNRVIALVSAPAKVQSPFDGASEMDMDDLWGRICILLRELKEKAPEDFARVEGAGIAAQGDGMWPVDAGGRPCGNAILWNDVRVRELCGVDAAALDALLVKNSSTALFAGASPMILKWLAEKQPERFQKIHRAVRCKDWLNYRLTGNILSDYTDHSTCGINIFTKKHVPEIYEFLGIPKAAEMLPPLAATTDIIGHVTAEASAETGLPRGVPVIAGAIDVVTAALGAGLYKPGDGCAILGTTLCNYILADESRVDVTTRSGSTLCGIMPGVYVRLMAALSGNYAIDWAKNLLAPEISFDMLGKELEKVPPGSNGVIYHPYICGERAPFRNPYAKGGFYNLSSRHSRWDMLRAACEGLALSLKDCHRALPEAKGDLIIAGGGSKSDLVCGIIANALGREILRPNRGELCVRGIIEAVKLGVAGIKPRLEPGEADRFTPDEQLVELYEGLYGRFTALREQMEPNWI